MKERRPVLSHILRLGSIFVILLLGTATPFAGSAAAADKAPSDVRGFSAALNPRGELWAVWSADDGHDTELLYSRWTGQGWQPPQPVYANPKTWDDTPSLAFAADGRPWLAWSSADREGSRLYVSRWLGYRWSRPEEVSPAPSTRPRQPALAAAPDGGFWLAWVGFDGNDDEIYARRWDGLAWLPAEQVGRDDTDPLAYDTQPRLVVAADGRPWLAWVSSQGLFDDALVASRWTGAAWSPEMPVSAPDGTPDVWPSLALDGQGQPWLAWQGLIGEGADAHWRIYLAHWLADAATWSAEEMVSSPAGLPVEEQRPSLTFGSDGTPHLAWAVLGPPSGIAYTTWQKGIPSPPVWAVEQAAAEAPLLLATDSPWLLWTDLTAGTAVPLTGSRPGLSRQPLPRSLPQSAPAPEGQCIYNRYVAWGDSITWGQYEDPPGSGQPVGDYPARLEAKLDARVTPSEVINRGIPGEMVSALRKRIGNEATLYLPQFPLIMEGTNDVTQGRPPNEVAQDLAIIIDILKKYSDIDGIRPWLSTIIPRTDGYYHQTQTMNDYIRDVAATKRVPLADNWQAFLDYGDWESLMWDPKHPNGAGMQLLADNWYAEVLDEYSWLYEDTTPPNTWIESLPPQSLCGQVTVSWNGSDNVSWVVSYDVQVNINGGEWTDWLIGTQDISGTYTSGLYNATVGFRVRGRDAAGNQGDYSTPAYTQITDDGPPYNVGISSLPLAQKAPFRLQWWATDDCSAVTAYDVEVRVGPTGAWNPWLSSTPFTSGTFDPAPPQYGQSYYFHARARDQAGNWSGWSSLVYTKLARFSVAGNVWTVRHQPVAGAGVTLTPAALNVERRPGGYLAYLADAGTYDLLVEHDNFGLLPPLHLSVSGDLSGVDLVLPPLDDVVDDGGFESGWGDWQPGGTLTPTRVTAAHTGNWAALLGGAGELSWLRQPLSLPTGLTDATLSFLVRLDNDAEGSSTLQVALEGTPISLTQTVSAGGWSHVWLPVETAAGHRNGIGTSQVVTLTFTVSDSAALRLDEVSLGSALPGANYVYLPIVVRE